MKKAFWFRSIVLIALSILFPSFVFPGVAKQEAQLYRNKGYEAQKAGNHEAAFTFYEKAINVDPTYAATYNDLGVLYEENGDIEKAKAMYIKATRIDSEYPRSYYNLASLYEAEGNFLRAAFYWEKRVQVGDQQDSGTLKAAERLRKISLIHPEVKIMVDDLARQGYFQDEKQGGGEIAKYLEKGRQAYKRGDYITAIKDFNDVLYLDPSNKEVDDLLEKSRKKLLMN